MDVQVRPLAGLVVDEEERYLAAIVAAFESDSAAVIGSHFLVAKNPEHHVPPARSVYEHKTIFARRYILKTIFLSRYLP
jgi:hypothetical protein